MSLEFLTVGGATAASRFAPVARSPMERQAAAAGGRHELLDGWSVAVGYGSSAHELELCRRTVGYADVSHLGKVELQGDPEDLRTITGELTGTSVELGHAARAANAWWCPLTPSRVLVICARSRPGALRDTVDARIAVAAGRPASIVDVTTAFAAMTLVGPMARETFARFCAIDLRADITPIGGLRPGSIARQPGILLREDEDRFLFLFGWAVAGYMWTVVEDAARHLGGGPVGFDVLRTLQPGAAGLPTHA